MKTINQLTVLLSMLITLSVTAQQGINYKALIKDGGGNVVANDLIVVQFQILQGGGMTNVYQETHTPTTDANGFVIVNIGGGSVDSGVYADIDWGSDDHYLNVQIDTGGGLADMGTTQFMAVPYALNAANAATKINELTDGKSDDDGSSVFLGLDAGFNDDGTSNENVGLGSQALYDNISASGNTAIGYATLLTNTTGYRNTAIGASALRYNLTGYRNTAVGSQALRDNDDGVHNTAIGWDALYSNISGGYNTATGSLALFSNTIGVNNTATGYQALFSNSTGSRNTAMGYQALKNNTFGNNNTAYGNNALSSSNGVNNTAIGHEALYNNNGSHNTAYGIRAGLNNINGSNNVFIGAYAGYSETGSHKLYIQNSSVDANNALIYGDFLYDTLTFNAHVGINTIDPAVPLHILWGTDANLNDGSGFIVAGDEGAANIAIDDNEIMARVNGATSNLYLQNSGGDLHIGGDIYSGSDRRLKQDIINSKYGLDEILKLRPVSYFWKSNPKAKQKSIGLIAQEVQPIIKELVSVNENRENTLAINYSGLIPVLVKAIQEQQEIIDEQNSKLKEQDSDIKTLMARMQKIENATGIN